MEKAISCGKRNKGTDFTTKKTGGILNGTKFSISTQDGTELITDISGLFGWKK